MRILASHFKSYQKNAVATHILYLKNFAIPLTSNMTLGRHTNWYQKNAVKTHLLYHKKAVTPKWQPCSCNMLAL